MKISIFGTRSGTEPSDGRQQTALSITVGDKIYWFDAGESCSETASEMGLNLLKVASVFISHPHIDHTGGLVKLLWVIDKLTEVHGTSELCGKIPVYCPTDNLWDAVKAFFIAERENMPDIFYTERIRDGMIFDDGTVKVTALKSTHIKPRAEGVVSYSFLIEAEGKRIIYSGDVGDFSDYSALLEGGCDYLLMETGHHNAMDVCKRAKDTGLIKKILFVHHHRKTVENFAEYTGSVYEKYGDFVYFTNDRDEIEV